MKWSYRIIRILLITVILLVAVVPAVLYVALSLGSVQRRVADRLETELSTLLGAEVSIGSLNIIPFSRATLRHVAVVTAPGDTAMTVDRLGAGISLREAIFSRRICVDYVELVGMDGRLRRDSIGAPLNIQPIIYALSPKDKKKPPTRFDLKISTVIIRASSVSYDVLSAPRLPEGVLDPNHLQVSRFRADVSLPRLANDDFTVNIRRMAMQERSGLTLRKLAGDFHIAANELKAENLDIELPASRLQFEPLRLPLTGLKSIRKSLEDNKINITLKDAAHLWLPDAGALYPPLRQVQNMLSVERMRLTGNLRECKADVTLQLDDLLAIDIDGEGFDLTDATPGFLLSKLEANASSELAPRLRDAGILPEKVCSALMPLGTVAVDASGRGTLRSFDGDIALRTLPGAVSAAVTGEYNDARNYSLSADVATDGYVDLSFLTAGEPAGVEGEAVVDFSDKGGHRQGTADILLGRAMFRGHALTDVGARLSLDGDLATVNADVNNSDAALTIDGEAVISRQSPALQLRVQLDRLLPDRFGLWQKYPGAALSGNADVNLAVENGGFPTGYVTLSDLALKPVDSEGIALKRLHIDSQNLDNGTSRVGIASDWLDGTLQGRFDFRTLRRDARQILAGAFPSLLPQSPQILAAGKRVRGKSTARRRSRKGTPIEVEAPENDFQFDFTIKETENIAEFFHLPVSVIYPVSIRGGMSQADGDLDLDISAPFLRQGGKLVENTALMAFVSGKKGDGRLQFHTTSPTKGGPMTLNLDMDARTDTVDTKVKWKIDRDRDYSGDIRLNTGFSRDADGLLASLRLLPSRASFNDSTWTIAPATVNIRGKQVDVNDINVFHGHQFIKINGQVSPDPSSLLTLDLSDFSLDYLFESLGIDAAMLGGRASGTFYASDIYTGNPRMETPGLHVKDISYNHTVLGDAVVKSWFRTSDKSVQLAADIDNQGRKSTVDGGIYATRDSLDLTFRVDREPVGFLAPYMSAFASDISGYASGWARVYGNFKYIDLEGDVKADSVQMRVNFTNTTYWATDSVHLRPGYIDLNGITVHDFHGHTAKLNGWVRHKYFKEPTFEFAITGAKNLLSYNETQKNNNRWYGTVYGDGSAFVKGVPGRVDISIDMQTAPGSTFTFVLSDQVEAEAYSFLTFRDKDRMAAEMTDTLHLRDTSMELVNKLREQAAHHDDTSSSDYNITIQMGVTPDARLILVMDPVGGDRIRAYGSGHLRMDYGSANNELKMYGNYTLDRGDYNFTLQDIIIKDFTIKPGSQIAFRGDPYAAQLDINAAYSLNANLSDLDESFLNDSELNRTNVPVNALMQITGDIQQPEIAFDLEFPTLTSDIYRKVRSIISTNEMMNRQILYLLALNRFYTPDYMAGATRGNELVSVASSTLSSQLGNILGQISDNWNIAPQLRSSRGDFSDVEVDVALSSRLLNNRLLFNGNFGYRDKSLNTNQFVGDFDLEYLLNRSGNFRLKAYNRYNDQNYYLRSALTTQGVGVILRKDFDSLTSFLRPLFRRRKSPASPAPAPTPTPSSTPSSTPAPSSTNSSPAPNSNPAPEKP